MPRAHLFPGFAPSASSSPSEKYLLFLAGGGSAAALRAGAAAEAGPGPAPGSGCRRDRAGTADEAVARDRMQCACFGGHAWHAQAALLHDWPCRLRLPVFAHVCARSSGTHVHAQACLTLGAAAAAAEAGTALFGPARKSATSWPVCVRGGARRCCVWHGRHQHRPCRAAPPARLPADPLTLGGEEAADVNARLGRGLGRRLLLRWALRLALRHAIRNGPCLTRCPSTSRGEPRVRTPATHHGRRLAQPGALAQRVLAGTANTRAEPTADGPDLALGGRSAGAGAQAGCLCDLECGPPLSAHNACFRGVRKCQWWRRK